MLPLDSKNYVYLRVCTWYCDKLSHVGNLVGLLFTMQKGLLRSDLNFEYGISVQCNVLSSDQAKGAIINYIAL